MRVPINVELADGEVDLEIGRPSRTGWGHHIRVKVGKDETHHLPISLRTPNGVKEYIARITHRGIQLVAKEQGKVESWKRMK